MKATKPLTKGRKVILAALTLLVIFGSVSLLGVLNNLKVSADTVTPLSLQQEPKVDSELLTKQIQASNEANPSLAPTPATVPSGIPLGPTPRAVDPADTNSITGGPGRVADSSDDYCDQYKRGLPGFKIVTPKSAICDLLKDFGEWVSKTAAKTIDTYNDAITAWIEIAGTKFASWVDRGWNSARTLVDILAVIALILVGFANILHINLNTYAVKRMLPRLVLAVIAANLSLFLIKGVSSISFAIADSMTKNATDGFTTLVSAVTQLFTKLVLYVGFADPRLAVLSPALTINSMASGGVAISLVFLIALLVGFVLALILVFLLFIQPMVVSILTIVAPIAITAMAIPPTEKVFAKWLSMLFNWIFMFPVSLFLFALMNLISAKLSDPILTQLSVIVADGVILLFAVRIPFAMGGDIAAGWGKAGKWAASLPSTGAKHFAAGYKPKYEGGKWGTAVNKARQLTLHGLPFVDPKLFMKGLKAPGERAELKAYGKAETLSWGYGKLIGSEGVMMAEAESKRNEHREENTDPQVLGEVSKKILLENNLAKMGEDGKLEIHSDVLEKLYELAKMKKVKLWDASFGKLEPLRGNKPSDFADLWAALTVLRQNAQAQRSPKAIGSRDELRNLNLNEILGSKRPLGANEEDFRNQGAGEEPTLIDSVPAQAVDGHEGEEGVGYEHALEEAVGGQGRVNELHVENLLVQNAEVSELGQLTTAADKVDSSRADLTGALKGANIGIDDAKLNDLVMAIQTYSEANTMQVRGLWWQSQLATPVLNRLSTTLRKLGFTNQDEVKALEGLGSQTGSLSADDVLQLAHVDPSQVTAEQKQPIEAALNRSQRAEQIRDLSYEYHAVKNIENQTGIKFPEMIGEVAEIGRVVKQPEDLTRMMNLVNNGIQRIDSPEATSIEGINKIRQETLGQAMPQRLPVTQSTDPLALRDQVKKELTSANAALKLASSNQAILEVAQKPGANLAQIEGAIKTSIGQAYAQTRQPRVAANQAAMAAEKKAAAPAGGANRTLPSVPPVKPVP